MPGYWVVMVNKVTGSASTEYVVDSDEAWQRSIDVEKQDPRVFATVAPCTRTSQES
ncbi:uncharacterized protein RMCFA_2678 [Mycolicibacterium fortuitum subsp. acetamidolyticum]|uniref:Uncharacterized protein n=1 Tax=Mycolicibacterium fortuitum subsp. acetamidolyticum TaxID=144550 RepID=A0A100WQK6_MYCFO|nr:uncharacterized protein RMCFA_2678 [Mycolicibacterium fortuitum subsp. acetamidolyticum]